MVMGRKTQETRSKMPDPRLESMQNYDYIKDPMEEESEEENV